MALDVERMVPDFIRRRFITKKETLAPNAGFGRLFTRTFGLESYGLTAQTISKALNPEMVSIRTKPVNISYFVSIVPDNTLFIAHALA